MKTIFFLLIASREGVFSNLHPKNIQVGQLLSHQPCEDLRAMVTKILRLFAVAANRIQPLHRSTAPEAESAPSAGKRNFGFDAMNLVVTLNTPPKAKPPAWLSWWFESPFFDDPPNFNLTLAKDILEGFRKPDEG